MKTITTRVCLGGPADGKRWAVEDGVRRIQVSDERGQISEYLEEPIAGQESVFTFWRWENVPVDEAIGLLFANYAPAAPR